MADLKLDIAHLARYSPRPGTVQHAACRMMYPTKRSGAAFALGRTASIDCCEDIHAGYLGRQVPVLFEEKVRGRWRGRTETNKLVFVEARKIYAAR
jgi:tRNA-2-methylthio-N6-dimethylallyladenosine synthase